MIVIIVRQWIHDLSGVNDISLSRFLAFQLSVIIRKVVLVSLSKGALPEEGSAMKAKIAFRSHSPQAFCGLAAHAHHLCIVIK